MIGVSVPLCMLTKSQRFVFFRQDYPLIIAAKLLKNLDTRKFFTQKATKIFLFSPFLSIFMSIHTLERAAYAKRVQRECFLFDLPKESLSNECSEKMRLLLNSSYILCPLQSQRVKDPTEGAQPHLFYSTIWKSPFRIQSIFQSSMFFINMSKNTFAHNRAI